MGGSAQGSKTEAILNGGMAMRSPKLVRRLAEFEIG
jgi:hypothetical protein